MLKFDFNRAMAQVRELRQIANDMQRNRNTRLNTASEAVRRSWSGATSQNYQSRLGELGRNMDREIQRVRTIADQIETTARRIAEEERELARRLAIQSSRQ